MKYILLCLYILIARDTISQKSWNVPFISKSDVYIYSLQFLGGASEGLHEEIVNHYPEFQRHYPNADSNYWNPKVSFKRKYKDFNNGDLRPAFFGSKSFLIAFTDAYHATNALTHVSNWVSIAIEFGDLKSYPKKERWKVVAKKLILITLANRIGFKTMYNIIL